MRITVILHVVILILLFVFGLTYLHPPEEKGIAINFGSSSSSASSSAPKKTTRSTPKEVKTQPSNKSKTDIRDKVVTQDLEDAPVIKEEKSEEVVREEVVKKPDPKPDKSTTDALKNILDRSNTKSSTSPQTGPGKNPGTGPGDKKYYGKSKGLDGDGNYLLGGRQALNKERYKQDCNEAGTVVVRIEVNRNGKVISAVPGERGTTNSDPCLLEPARRAALATRFNSDSNAPAKQVGEIIYKFKLSQ